LDGGGKKGRKGGRKVLIVTASTRLRGCVTGKREEKKKEGKREEGGDNPLFTTPIPPRPMHGQGDTEKGEEGKEREGKKGGGRKREGPLLATSSFLFIADIAAQLGPRGEGKKTVPPSSSRVENKGKKKKKKG